MSKTLNIAVCLFVALIIGIVLWAFGMFQFSRPFGPAAPVVPALPSLAAELRQAKSLCEGRGVAVKDAARKGSNARRQLTQGRTLYEATRLEVDGCISYICTAMDRRFIREDEGAIARKMSTCRATMDEFITWADKMLVRPKASVDPFDAASKLLP